MAMKARMPNVLLWLGVVVITLTLSAQAHACNARNEFCNYPVWAANAFSHPKSRVPDAALEIRPYRAAVPSTPIKRSVTRAPKIKTAKGTGSAEATKAAPAQTDKSIGETLYVPCEK
jgi:hypothetical protein